MILGFKTEMEGKPTFFVEKIRACVSPTHAKTWTPKIHTIRKGHRWKAGTKMHMAIGVRTPDYYQFNTGEYAALDHCVSVQDIEIIPATDQYPRRVIVRWENWHYRPDMRIVSGKDIELLAKNDGFESVDDFWNWFKEDFKGQIIHFTDFRY